MRQIKATPILPSAMMTPSWFAVPSAATRAAVRAIMQSE
jgi:hypothetical protein